MKKNIFKVITLVLVMWTVFLLNDFLNLGLNQYGILPRTAKGLPGIFLSPFLHGSIYHIMSNTLPFLFLTSTLYVFYSRIADKVLFLIIVFGGIMVWLFAESAYHIGASGVIYGVAAFLIACGFYKKKLQSILISIVVMIAYGGLIWGVFPSINTHISWEGHLFGAIAGVIVARMYRKK